jgi:hypothetical protein
MVNNATNINKTKDSLNSNGQQCHQYQQKEQLLLRSLKIKKTTTYDVRNPGPGLRQAQQCSGLYSLIRSHSPLDNWISNGYTYKQTI